MQKINLIAQSVLELSHRENADDDNDDNDDNDDDDEDDDELIEEQRRGSRFNTLIQ